MLEWEWYDDINTKVLFIHLLLKANWKGKEWRWEFIERWSFITSYQKLSDETGLSLQQIRTSINKLKSTGEITYLWQASNSLIKLNKYDEYQTSNTLDNTLATNEQQTSNKRVTTTNKYNKEKKETIYIWATRSEVLEEINNIVIYWNETWKEERKVTPKLQEAYLKVRRDYPKDDIKIALKKYTERKKKEPDYLLDPIRFFTQSKNWFITYL